jgi:putative glutamine amidotransferase
MKKAPLILITPCVQREGMEFSDTSLSLSDRYPRALLQAGAIPWVLPCLPDEALVAEAVRRADGVMLTGGDDVQTKLYTKKLAPELLKTVSPAEPQRDLLEAMLVQEVFQQRKPLLAICRGHQMLNVALGGTLIVDIPSQLPQAQNHRRGDLKDQPVHDIILAPGSRLARIFQRTVQGVNSSHHQAVARVAKPLAVTATSPDGVIEGMELAPGEANLLPYLLSVQFHPERMCDGRPEFVRFFMDFVKACAASRRKK